MSGRGTHYAAGLVTGLVVGQVGVWLTHWSVTEALATGVVGMLAGPGMDVDQRGWWRKLDKMLPD